MLMEAEAPLDRNDLLLLIFMWVEFGVVLQLGVSIIGRQVPTKGEAPLDRNDP